MSDVRQPPRTWTVLVSTPPSRADWRTNAGGGIIGPHALARRTSSAAGAWRSRPTRRPSDARGGTACFRDLTHSGGRGPERRWMPRHHRHGLTDLFSSLSMVSEAPAA